MYGSGGFCLCRCGFNRQIISDDLIKIIIILHALNPTYKLFLFISCLCALCGSAVFLSVIFCGEKSKRKFIVFHTLRSPQPPLRRGAFISSIKKTPSQSVEKSIKIILFNPRRRVLVCVAAVSTARLINRII